MPEPRDLEFEVFKDFFIWRSVPWLNNSLCRKIPNLDVNKIFFPKKKRGPRTGVDVYAVGKNICTACPVRWDCLLARLDETEGVVGGTDPEQRIYIRAVTRIRTKTYLQDLTTRIQNEQQSTRLAA